MRELEKVISKKGKRFLFRVETSNNHEDYLKYERLRQEIWEFPDDHMAGTRHMMCENLFYEGSSLFIGVFKESQAGGFSKQDKAHLVGFAYGFIGVKDKEMAFKSMRNLQFYSQFTAVRKDFQKYGLGISIKEFQREKLMDLFGIYTATCTYDPLVGVNAYRNIHHLGMEVVEYKVDMYGNFGGLLNRAEIPSDRLFMTWDLKRELQKSRFDIYPLIKNRQIVTEVEIVEIQGKSGSLELEIIKKVHLDLDHDLLLVEIPFNFYRILQETDVKNEETRNIPLAWRMTTRKAFLGLLERGYKVFDFIRMEAEKRKRDFYVFRRI